MSFPRASIKRFNDEAGCAPAPGTYEARKLEKASGGVVDKSDRFKHPKESSSLLSVTVSNTPVKQSAPTPQKGKKAAKPLCLLDNSRIKELELEIRRLVKERSEKDKLLTQREEELKKLDGKLHNAQSDKSSLQARLVTAEKEWKEAKKATELLKAKVSSSDTAAKKHEEVLSELSSLKQQLSQKDGEIARLTREVDMALATLLSDVQMFEAITEALEENIATLDSFVNSLGKDGKDANDSGCKTHKTNDDTLLKIKDGKMTVENKVKILKKKSENLHHRFTRAVLQLSGIKTVVEKKYLSVVEEHTTLQGTVSQVKRELHAAVEARAELEKCRDGLLSSNTDLELQVKQLTDEKSNILDSYSETQRKLEELKLSKETLEEQFHKLERLHIETQKQDADQIISLESKEIVLSEATSRFHERMVILQAENEDLLATLKETGELLSKTKEENMHFEEMLLNAETKQNEEKREFLLQFEDLQFQKSKVESELSDADEKVRVLTNDALRLQAESGEKIESLVSQLDGEKVELEQLQNKLGDLVYEKSQLNSEIGHLEAQLKLLKSEAEQTRTEADNSLQVIPKLQNKIKEIGEEKEMADKTVQDLEEQNNTLQVTLENFQLDFDDYVRTADEDRQSAQDKIVSLTSDVDGLREQRDQMVKELDDWLLEKSELDIEVAKLQCRIKVLEMEMDQVKQETDAELRVQCEETERVTLEKQQIQTDMTQYGMDLLTSAAQIQSLQADLHRETSERETLASQNKTLASDLEKKVSALADVDRTCGEITQKYTSKCREYEDLMEEKAQLVDKLQEKTERCEDLEEEQVRHRDAVQEQKERCDDLDEENGQLQDRVQEYKERCEDLEGMLQQTRGDFLKRCDERDTLLEKNEMKDTSLGLMSQQVSEVTQQLEQVQDTLEQKCQECEELSQRCTDKESELTASNQQICNFKQQIEDYTEHLQLKSDELDELQTRYEELDQELTLSVRDVLDLQDRITSLQEEKTSAVQSCEQYRAEIADLQQQQAGAADTSALEEEVARYRTLYEELQTKVEPFMEQINAFELEKQQLLGLNKNTQAEMEKLGREYAQLLGHQNQKQKIKHIVKIKDENNGLKKENVTLKEQVTRLRRQVQKMEDKSSTGTRRFDPAKAFLNTKTDLVVTQPPKSPLKENSSNRK